MTKLTDYPVIYEQNVAWGDMDAFGHVNNVIYYRYIESARICYLDVLNIFKLDINTVVASSQCKYLKPVFYPDQLKIGVRVEEIRNSAFRMNYLIWSSAQQQNVALGEAVIVCVDKENMQKTLIPEIIREKIIKIEKTVKHDLNNR
ncbi:acyl-CoA thioesterase [Acinetobacter radioresistens]|uniref:acyl-CoA thioesterase n=1 Tax=Acinetobacter radioresistens TaxID=40216 RepID=UPI000DADCB3E|nr:thioesterase family protein [Acinetobacter radioresistens]AWV85216.1 acyl-CoA thioesterase [Acinetobacter radioresistens]MCX0328187.1 acyl-CoA thioesterase [Acinetobacter radioresistens]MCX0340379.1 acyl-CoA thioesterase [Acinetobacter radioresistens]HCK63522.1 thioesterase [Acinetobacter radioresistens]